MLYPVFMSRITLIVVYSILFIAFSAGGIVFARYRGSKDCPQYSSSTGNIEQCPRLMCKVYTGQLCTDLDDRTGKMFCRDEQSCVSRF